MGRWLQAPSFRETLRVVRVWPLVGVVGFGFACSQPAPTAAPAPASSVFSADAGVGLSVVDGADGGPPLAKEPERGVLAEILAAAPKELPKPTDADGGTLIGTETGADGVANPLGTKGTLAMAHGKKATMIESGSIEVQSLPAHAAERTARAQIYYPLVMRCRDADGRILPPDAIVLRFRLDEDGNIVPSSISAIAVDPRHESAANCMRRELSAAAFRGPAATRGSSVSLKATIPSVD
jgi:hypothetical protein